MRTDMLLQREEPEPMWVENPGGRSPFLLICDHAGNRIPANLGDLGLPPPERERHIAWDIGIAGVGRQLAHLLDATCIGQTYSRLVIDCNRTPGTAESIVETSDGTAITGNQGLTPQEVERRRREIFEPYHQRIVEELDARAARAQLTCLILLHSFTPEYGGATRPWQVGVLYSSRDTRLARPLLEELREEKPHGIVGDNEPYSAEDESDFALPAYGLARDLLHVELEIRQDLIAAESGQREWAEQLCALLPRALHGALTSPPKASAQGKLENR